MRRRIVVVLLAIAIAVVAGLWWRARQPWKKQVSASASEALVADPRLSLGVSAPGRDWDPEFPERLRVTLVLPPTAATPPIGSAERPWWQRLRLLRSAGASETEIPFEVIEPRENPRGDGESQFATLALIPGTLAPGEITLRAVLDHPAGEMRSGSVTRRVRAGVLRPELRLLGQVEVHVAAGRAAEALALIERVSMPVAEWPEMHALRGEALAQLGRTEEAIEAYRLALDRVPEDTQEPPVLYLRRLQELEESAAR